MFMKIQLGDLRRLIREEVEFSLADYFVPGDPILFGKWKNKRGIIVGMWEDEDGYPVVEIEPQPKGRKDNVTMGLFKIRRDTRYPLER